MIDAEIRNAIWTLYKQGKTKQELARLFDLDKKTVFKIIKLEGRVPTARRKDKKRPDHELISQVYKRCEGFARRTHEVLTKEYSVEIGYSTLNRVLQEIEASSTKDYDPGPPRIVKPGEFMQHDTSPHVLNVGGKRSLLQCAGLYFRYSKVRYIKYYRSFDKFAMKGFMFEAASFWKHMGGLCVIDNTSLAVRSGTGENAIFHDDMKAFARQLGFEWVAHPLKKPNWKAGKERNFRTVETNFIPGRTFKSMDDLNRQALAWATEWYFRHPDDKTKLVPAAQWEVEKPYLTLIPDYIEPPYKDYMRSTDNNGFIPVYANYYWIPKTTQKEVKVVEYPGRIKVYRDRELLIEYPLKPCDVKYERVTPDGCRVQKNPRHLHQNSREEEAKLRSTGGESMVRYLDFVVSKEGAVRYRHKFMKNLYSLSQRIAPGVLEKAIARALAYKINNCDAIERIASQLMRADVQDWPEVESAVEFQDREAYLEGRLSDEPDLFAYAKLLKPTGTEKNGGSDDGSGSKN
ncbi:hypothetical protein BH10PLA2_BH10PLA2_16520 [soil metagenome]